MAGAVNVATLITRLTADISDFTNGLNNANNQANSFSEKMKAVGGKLTAFVSVPLAGVGFAAFNAAADVAESMSKVDAVFGESAKRVHDFAKSSAKNLGVSKASALAATGQFGNLFDQLKIAPKASADMSIGLVTLARDLASFNNASVTEVIEAQTAAFRGEFDTLQRFIPTINAAAVAQKALELTGKANADMLTEQDKALAVNALMHEGAGKAVGDYARTQDSSANKMQDSKARMEDAAATLGEKLTPAFEKLVSFVADKLIPALDSLSGGNGVFVVLAAFMIGPMITAIGALAGSLGVLSTAFWFLAMNPVVAVTLAVAAFSAGMVIAYKNSETFRNVINASFQGAANGVLDAVGWILDAVDKVIGTFATMAESASKIPVVGGKFKGLAEDMRGAQDAVQEWADWAHKGIDITASSADKATKSFWELAKASASIGQPGIFSRGQDFAVAGRSAGGPIRAGADYLVGEKGPELFRSNVGGTIVPNHQLASGLGGGMGGGAVNVNIYTSVLTADGAREIRDALAELERKAA